MARDDRWAAIADHPWFAPAVLFVVAMAIRLLYLDRAPDYDELYHVLAAQGWLDSGAFKIADGEYSRAELFTVIVALFFKFLGESLVVARLPSVLAGSLLVVAVFLWTRSVAGRRAAWIAALLLCFSSLAVQVSQFARFYALHALVFWLASVAMYSIVEASLARSAKLVLILLAGGALLFSIHLQVITLFGLLGLALWAAGSVALPWLRARHDPRALLWAGAALLAAGVLLVALLAQTELGQELIERYRWVPLHASEDRDKFWFYHLLFLKRLPLIWMVFPFLIMIALAVRPRVTLFCLSVFVPAFMLASFGGMKSQRYVAYLMPYLFVIAGIGCAAVWDGVSSYLRRSLDVGLGHLNLAGRGLRAVALGVALLFLLASNGEWTKTTLMLGGIRMRAEGDGITLDAKQQSANWAQSATLVRPIVGSAPLVLTTRDLYSLFYLGGFDILVNPSQLSQIDGPEFSLDPRTGRPVVGSAAAVELIMACHPSGVFVTDTYHWRTYPYMTEQIADVVEREATPIELPEGAGLLLFRWQHATGQPPPAACAGLPLPARTLGPEQSG